MKTRTSQLLANAAGQLMQQHAFDHLTDEKLSRMNKCMFRLGHHAGLTQVQEELLELCCEADLFTDTATPDVLNQWFTIMSCFSMHTTGPVSLFTEEAGEKEIVLS
jgi:hypothetical protein